MSRQPTILVVGASGRIAGLVVPELRRRGARVRALARDDESAASARRRGAHEIAPGDLRDVDSLVRATRGADGVFHVGAAFVDDEVQLGRNMIEAAIAGGVERFAFSGVIHPTNGLANHTTKAEVERELYASGLRFAVLQPATLMQNLAGAWADVVRTGTFGEPFSADARVVRVDYRDVAEVAAIALTDDRLAYGTYELATDERLDRHELAATMGAVLGREITATEPDFDTWRANVNLDYAERQWAQLAAVHADYDAHGSAANGLVLEAILGRAPRTVRAFLEELHGTQTGATT